MTVFSHVHASGRFNQSPSDFAKGLTGYRKVASVITVTEVDRNTRAKLLASEGWQGVWGDKGPRDDCGISWDPTVWSKIWADTVTLSHARYKNDRGDLADTTEAAFAVLKHKETGKVVLWGSLHTPHGMQEDLRNGTKSDVAIAFISITRAYRRHSRKLEKQYDVDAVSLSADWNLNIRNEWANRYLTTYARVFKLKLNWTGNFPAWGTIGRQIIDATLYKGMNMKTLPKLLPRNAGDDHVAYKEAFNL